MVKYDYAKKAFERKKYMQAATLLEELVAIFKGTDRAEESLYLLARSYYLNKDYITSGEYFQAYYKNYPKGEYTELARFYCGYGYYLDSPEAKLIKQALIEQSMKCSVSSIISRIANGLNRHRILFLSYKTNLCIKSY